MCVIYSLFRYQCWHIGQLLRFFSRFLLHFLFFAIGLSVVSYPALAVVDALEAPAPRSDRAQHSLLLDITQAGDRLVALGERGHILYSSDQGGSWHQADVPVRVTLTAIDFPNAQQGWAVGHDGVILTSRDGGLSWHKQLDGYQANALIEHEIERLLALSAKERVRQDVRYQTDELNYLQEDAELFTAEGASRPFLDVLFLDQKVGFAVGAYGMIFRTQDSGEHWTPWVAHLQNPNNFHINALAKGSAALYMAGEAGSLYRSDDHGLSWISLPSPYSGPLFGVFVFPVAGKSERLIAFGLRGNAFISLDKGMNWQHLKVNSDAAILGALRLSLSQFTLLSSGGELFRFDSEGQSLGRSLTPDSSALSSGLTTEQGRLLLVGMKGMTYLNLPQIEWEAP